MLNYPATERLLLPPGKNKLMKYILIICGSLCTILGFIGIFIPGLPTTPFLLLAAALFLRSSEKLHRKLVSNPLLGKYLKNFHRDGGMTLGVKLISLAIMWGMITVSLILVTGWWLRLILAVLGIIGTVVMGFVIKTVGKKQE